MNKIIVMQIFLKKLLQTTILNFHHMFCYHGSMQEIQNGENSQNFYLLHWNFVSILIYKIQLQWNLY